MTVGQPLGLADEGPFKVYARVFMSQQVHVIRCKAGVQQPPMPNIAKRKTYCRSENQKSPAPGPRVKNQQQRSQHEKKKRIRDGIRQCGGSLTGQER